jgi:hypothetical protein
LGLSHASRLCSDCIFGHPIEQVFVKVNNTLRKVNVDGLGNGVTTAIEGLLMREVTARPHVGEVALAGGPGADRMQRLAALGARGFAARFCRRWRRCPARSRKLSTQVEKQV